MVQEVVVDELGLQAGRAGHTPGGDRGVALVEHQALGGVKTARVSELSAPIRRVLATARSYQGRCFSCDEKLICGFQEASSRLHVGCGSHNNQRQGTAVEQSGRSRPLRVVQWTTGHVGRESVAGIVAHPQLELVGVFAHSPDKVGKDTAELCGLHEPTGVSATAEARVDALLALEPDCVIYNALHIDPEEVAGSCGPASTWSPRRSSSPIEGLGPEATALLEQAAQAGAATMVGTGVNPGFASLFAAVSAGISREVRTISVYESADVALFASDPNFAAVGWGRRRAATPAMPMTWPRPPRCSPTGSTCSARSSASTSTSAPARSSSPTPPRT